MMLLECWKGTDDNVKATAMSEIKAIAEIKKIRQFVVEIHRNVVDLLRQNWTECEMRHETRLTCLELSRVAGAAWCIMTADQNVFEIFLMRPRCCKRFSQNYMHGDYSWLPTAESAKWLCKQHISWLAIHKTTYTWSQLQLTIAETIGTLWNYSCRMTQSGSVYGGP